MYPLQKGFAPFRRHDLPYVPYPAAAPAHRQESPRVAGRLNWVSRCAHATCAGLTFPNRV